ncbi:Ig-like domain-containing protein [Acinetobacter sp. VNH17]|uniref:Ig-like domain-containing protein n=1 Tax=Acinetobacter thutiue TaxID=2998078 RepID=A0ABT7WQ56_9GAMM|nr:Ig-like domain-containing protein [Acinetobacter thutiue]MCY6412715.1 Ig-like domain-containing protein [Acinetobacter thutiue]MDN0014822.1 Ig-like domain-containing protein [Acinetobacter thutiue]
MTRIYLVDKSIHKTTTKSEVIATGQSTAIPLDQRLMAKFEIHPEQVSSIVRVGNNAVVHLIDGTQVVLEGFFVQELLQLPLQDGQSLWATLVEDEVTEQPIDDYLVLDGVPPEAVVPDSSIVPAAGLNPEIPAAIVPEATGAAASAATAGTIAATTVPTWALVAGGLAGAGAIGAAVSGGSDKKDNLPDTTAPTQPQGGFTDNKDGKTITGQAEAGSTVIVKDAAGKELAKATVGADGKFSVTLPNALSNGEQVNVTVKDPAGNESTVASITAPDTTAPTKPESTFTDNKDGKTITGQAEAGSTVIVKDAAGKELAKATVGADGKFSVTLPNALSNGEQVNVTVKDSAGNESTVASITAPDTTAPVAGTLGFTNLIDTGTSSTDRITQDKAFDLNLMGQETGSTVKYQLSKDGGAWTNTTANQTNLSDGVYQFKAIVTDKAGNSAETLSPKVTVDNTVPAAGTLTLTNLTDTGSSSTDRITQDKNFDLSLTGQEANTTIMYQVSKDGGVWTNTTVNQNNLADGIYQFKAIVTDRAGNSSEVLSSKITVDNTIVAGNLSFINFVDSGALATDHITQDKAFDLSLTGQETGTTVIYQVSKDSGVWSNTTAKQSNLTDGVYQFKAIVTDKAGNSAEVLSSKVTVDNTVPVAGVLSFANLTDTGSSSTDRITQDKNFDLTLTGQEAGTTVVYQVSKDNGAWTTTTANQTNLTDRIYQFKAIVTDKAGNSAEVLSAKVTVDNTAPIAGTLSFTNFTDTGSSFTDQITQDKAFDLSLTGQETGATIQYQVSKDGGIWTNTTANQTNLSDGVYQFKAIVTDKAGNSAETLSTKITVDNTPPATGILSFANLDDTGVSDTDGITKDKVFNLALTGQEAGTTVIYQVSKDGSVWADTSVEQSGLVDGVYQFKAIVTDKAGNSAEVLSTKLTVDNTVPVAGMLSFTNLTDTGSSATDQITQDKAFDLTLIGQETGTTVIYQVSKDNGAWTTTTVSQTNLTDGIYQFKAIVTDKAGNSSEALSSKITVDNTIVAGSLLFTNLTDTGLSSTDLITQDKAFDLSLTGQEVGTTVVYQVSKDNGAWTTTTPSQTNLTDGVYQFKAIVTDVAGNSAEVLSSKVTVDNTAPVAGTLSFTNLTDTGSSSTDLITQDKAFDLTLTGQEAGTTVVYQVSKDNGAWTNTTANQTDLTDGVYQFKAIVTDKAGNSAEVLSSKVTVDNTAPVAGALSITNLSDTGSSSTDLITQDKSFDLSLTGQETGTTVVYQVSKDNGAWITTTPSQTNLADGVYQFKAVVTDVAGNSAETLSSTVTVDNTPPVAGTLSFSNLTDTGISTTDLITQDKTFDLSLTGREAGTTVVYQVSKDNGTWANTTANQTNLADGVYQFKAIVTDVAGNSAETLSPKLTVDNTPPAAGVLSFSSLTDTGISSTDLITQDKAFDLSLTGQEAGTTVVYQVSKDNGAWTATTASQTNLADGIYQFKAIVTDVAGNSAETFSQIVTVDNTPPAAGTLSFNNLTDTGISSTDRITQDKAFDLSLTGQEQGTTVVYQVSVDGGQTWVDTDTAQSNLADGVYQFKAIVTDVAGNSAETLSPIVTVDNTAPVTGTLAFANFNDTGILATDYITKDQAFDLSLTGQEAGTTVVYQVSKDNGVWVNTDIAQSNLVDGHYQFKAIVTDKAGNSAETLSPIVVVDNTPPVAGTLTFSNLNDTGASAIDRITQDNSFDLQSLHPIVIGEEAAITDHYEVSTDGGLTWITTTAQQTNLADGTYQFKAIETDVAGNIVETAIETVVVDTLKPQIATDLFISEDGWTLTGLTEAAGLKVNVFDQNGLLVGTTESYANGEFSLQLDKSYVDNEEFTVVLRDRAGNESDEANVVALGDVTRPEAATGLELSEGGSGSILTGKAEPDAIIKIYDQDNNLIHQWNNNVNADGTFTIYLNQYYLKGQTLTVTVTDAADNVSESATIVAPTDNTNPEPIDEVVFDENGLNFTAQAEANSTVKVYDIDNNQVGTGYADSEGNVSGWFDHVYLDGQLLTFIVFDRAGNQSAEVPLNAINDDSIPDPATNLVLIEENGGSVLTGTAEPNATIQVYDQDDNLVYQWNNNVKADGTFEIYFNQYYLKGQTLTVTVTDRAGLVSEKATIVAPLDNTNPEPIQNIEFNEDGRNFTATAEANSTVKVFYQGNEVGSGYTDSEGKVSGYFYEVFLDGQELSFIVVDRAQNESDTVNQNALTDRDAPAVATDLELIEGGFGSILLGKAEPYATIQVTDANGNSVTAWLANITVQVDGTFRINLNDYYLHGETLKVTVTDRAGNISEVATIDAPIDEVKPDPLDVEHIIFNENGLNFTAVAEANSTIKVLYQGNEVGQGYTDSDGNVYGSFNQVFLDGQELTFIVVDRAENESNPVTAIALNDDIAPLAAENVTVTPEGWISGEAEPNAMVDVIDKYGAVITSIYVNYNGSFGQLINLSQYQSQELSIVVKDAAGNRSDPVYKLLPALVDTPAAAIDLVLDAEGHVLTGMATAGFYIVVTNAAGERVDSGWWNTLVNEDGTFSIQLNDYYLQGQTLQVRVVDLSTNQYSPITEIVAPLDDILPVVENVVISEDGYSVAGQTEPKSTIKIVDADGDLRGEYQADETGYFNFSVYPQILRGEQLFITATDLAKNVSNPFSISFNADSNAPNPAENVVVSENGFFIEGDAVPNGYVRIVNTQSNAIGSGLVDEFGHFNIQLYSPQANGEVLRVVVEENGYQSAYIEITAPIDNVVPEAATELVLENGQLLSGQAEAYLTIKIFDADNNQVGQTTVDANGTFTTYLWYPYWHGETLTVKVVDGNQNESPDSTIVATNDTTAPDAATQLAINEWGYLTGHAETNATVEVTYYFADQEPYTNSATAVNEGTFEIYMYDNATSFDVTVVDRAGNHSPTVTVNQTEIPHITVDQLRGDNTDNIYQVDHTYDFVQEYIVEYYETYEEVWVGAGYYEQQWVEEGHYEQQWVEGHYEDVWVEGYYDYVWVDSGEWRYRDYYSDQYGVRYYTDDGSYDSYFSTYYDYSAGQWQEGYALDGPFVEEEWFGDGYYEYQWVDGHYEQQWVDGYYEDVWVDTSHYEDVWVEGGYWENQLVDQGYRDVDFGGHDKIISSVSYSLVDHYDSVNDPTSAESYLESGRYVEDLELVGSANLSATGNGLDNVITGNTGDNILDGRGGHDTFFGGAGSDTVIYNLLNYSDGLVDSWQDFHVGNVQEDSQADKIDLSELLTDYAGDGSVDSLSGFINVSQDGDNTVISIDRDGGANGYPQVQLVTLNQIHTTLDELLANQQLII